MKRYVAFWTTVLLIVLQCSVAQAGSVKLSWNPNSEADLAGYKIYWERTPRPVGDIIAGTHYGNVTDAKNVNCFSISGLENGKWCFAATAYNESGAESVYSNEVCTIINSAPVAPVLLKLDATDAGAGK